MVLLRNTMLDGGDCTAPIATTTGVPVVGTPTTGLARLQRASDNRSGLWRWDTSWQYFPLGCILGEGDPNINGVVANGKGQKYRNLLTSRLWVYSGTAWQEVTQGSSGGGGWG